MEPFDIAIIACVSVIVALMVLICLCKGVRKKKEQKTATILSGRTEKKSALLSGRTYGGAAERGDGMVSSGTSGDGMAFSTGVAIAATAALTIASDLDGGGNGGDGGGG